MTPKRYILRASSTRQMRSAACAGTTRSFQSVGHPFPRRFPQRTQIGPTLMRRSMALKLFAGLSEHFKFSNAGGIMDQTRIVVTGAAGFLGSYVTRQLVDDGYDVYALL